MPLRHEMNFGFHLAIEVSALNEMLTVLRFRALMEHFVNLNLDPLSDAFDIEYFHWWDIFLKEYGIEGLRFETQLNDLSLRGIS